MHKRGAYRIASGLVGLAFPQLYIRDFLLLPT